MRDGDFDGRFLPFNSTAPTTMAEMNAEITPPNSRYSWFEVRPVTLAGWTVTLNEKVAVFPARSVTVAWIR